MMKSLIAAGFALGLVAAPAAAAIVSTLEIEFSVALNDVDGSGNFTAGDTYTVGLRDNFFQPTVSAVNDEQDPYFEPNIDVFAFDFGAPGFGSNPRNTTVGLQNTVFGFEPGDNATGSFTLGGFTFAFQGVEGFDLDTEGALRGGTVEGFISITGNGFPDVADASYRFSGNSNSGAGTTGSLQIAVPADFEFNVIPVPASLPLLAAGLLGLGYMGTRRRKG